MKKNTGVNEFPCKQMKTTDNFRSGWEAIWGDKEDVELVTDSQHKPEDVVPPSSFSFGRPRSDS